MPLVHNFTSTLRLLFHIQIPHKFKLNFKNSKNVRIKLAEGLDTEPFKRDVPRKRKKLIFEETPRDIPETSTMGRVVNYEFESRVSYFDPSPSSSKILNRELISNKFNGREQRGFVTFSGNKSRRYVLVRLYNCEKFTKRERLPENDRRSSGIVTARNVRSEMECGYAHRYPGYCVSVTPRCIYMFNSSW